jgi:hypothetical protein
MEKGRQSNIFASPQDAHRTSRSLHTVSYPHNHADPPLYISAAGNTSHTLMPTQSRLTELGLVEHDLLYDDSEATFQAEVRMRELQNVGRKLGFGLPLHCYEKDQWRPHDWIEEQTHEVRQR